MVVLIVGICIYVLTGIFWGSLAQSTSEDKGYHENCFWWGFFFNLIGYIIVCSKPDNKSTYANGENLLNSNSGPYRGIGRHDDSDSYWECKKCKRKNAIYVGTCGCGNTKQNNSSSDFKSNEQTQELAGTNNTRSNSVSGEIIDKEKEIINILKQYKELVDSGAITEEEFQAKKKSLLFNTGE